MFEKEAETTFKKKATKIAEKKVKEFYKECGWEDYKYMISEFTDVGTKCMQKGAEFGYNKANEWHYPLKGEYPKEYKDILICFLTEDDMKDCVRGWYEYDLDEDEHYFKTVNTFGTAVIKNVYAWKEIVLPELKEG